MKSLPRRVSFVKKFISGVIVGALLFGAVPTFAASGLLGQKVQGVFTVEKNGTKISEAVVINGSAYAPVRAVAEATGVNLKVEGKKIIMSSESFEDISEKNSVKISTLKATITNLESNIEITSKGELASSEAKLISAKETDNGTPESALVISSLEQRVKESKAYIADQQKLIDQAKAEIEKLQGQLNP
jgi:hypothetical protein